MMFKEYYTNLFKPVKENNEKMAAMYNANLQELNKIGEQTGKFVEQNVNFYSKMQQDAFNVISELATCNTEFISKFSPKM